MSWHSLASGALIQRWVPNTSLPMSLLIIVFGSCFVGVAITLAVRIGNIERKWIVRMLDRLPVLVVTVLVLACGWCVHHVAHHLLSVPKIVDVFFFFIVASCALLTALAIRDRNPRRSRSLCGPSLVKLSSHKST
jgi:hypothetical protein